MVSLRTDKKCIQMHHFSEYCYWYRLTRWPRSRISYGVSYYSVEWSPERESASVFGQFFAKYYIYRLYRHLWVISIVGKKGVKRTRLFHMFQKICKNNFYLQGFWLLKKIWVSSKNFWKNFPGIFLFQIL